jgi:anthranilate phosphoribosyltransferase
MGKADVPSNHLPLNHIEGAIASQSAAIARAMTAAGWHKDCAGKVDDLRAMNTAALLLTRYEAEAPDEMTTVQREAWADGYEAACDMIRGALEGFPDV